MHVVEAPAFLFWSIEYDVFSDIFDVMTFMLMSDVEPLRNDCTRWMQIFRELSLCCDHGYLNLALFFRQL